jgi:hypothetical protein
MSSNDNAVALSSKARYLEQQSQLVDRLSLVLGEFGLTVKPHRSQRTEVIDPLALPHDHVIDVLKPLYGNTIELTISVCVLSLNYMSYDVVIPSVAEDIISRMCPSVTI